MGLRLHQYALINEDSPGANKFGLCLMEITQMIRYLPTTDSRGNDLEWRINAECRKLGLNFIVKVLILSRRNIKNMLKDAEIHLGENLYDGIYFMGGVNNLFSKRISKKIKQRLMKFPIVLTRSSPNLKWYARFY